MKKLLISLFVGFSAISFALPVAYTTCKNGPNHVGETAEDLIQQAKKQRVVLCIGADSGYRLYELTDMAQAHITLGFDTESLQFTKEDLQELSQNGPVYLAMTYQKFGKDDLIELAAPRFTVSIPTSLEFDASNLHEILAAQTNSILEVDSNYLSIEDLQELLKIPDVQMVIFKSKTSYTTDDINSLLEIDKNRVTVN